MSSKREAWLSLLPSDSRPALLASEELDQLAGLPNVRARKMFGEYALYCDEKVVALVCDNRLFVKITEPGRALVGDHYAEGEAYPGAKPSMLIGAEEIDDEERLCRLIRATADALPVPKPKKTKRKKGAMI